MALSSADEFARLQLPTPYHVLTDSHRLVETEDILDMVRWLQDHHDADVVGRDEFYYHDQRILVSTVFFACCLDHLPDGRLAVYETAVFGGDHDGLARRYGSWDEAVAGHDKILKQVRRSVQEKIHAIH